MKRITVEKENTKLECWISSGWEQAVMCRGLQTILLCLLIPVRECTGPVVLTGSSLPNGRTQKHPSITVMMWRSQTSPRQCRDYESSGRSSVNILWRQKSWKLKGLSRRASLTIPPPPSPSFIYSGFPTGKLKCQICDSKLVCGNYLTH